ncbi:unnamed protein product, partial [Didymodactylos carnosus]
HLIVATPGRLYDLMNKNLVNTNLCSMADKLLSQDFRGMCEQLFQYIPAERQVLLYSATFPVSIDQFVQRYMRNPYEINLMNELTLQGITQYYAFVQEKQKVHCLNTLFSKVINDYCVYVTFYYNF